MRLGLNIEVIIVDLWISSHACDLRDAQHLGQLSAQCPPPKCQPAPQAPKITECRRKCTATSLFSQFPARAFLALQSLCSAALLTVFSSVISPAWSRSSKKTTAEHFVGLSWRVQPLGTSCLISSHPHWPLICSPWHSVPPSPFSCTAIRTSVGCDLRATTPSCFLTASSSQSSSIDRCQT